DAGRPELLDAEAHRGQVRRGVAEAAVPFTDDERQRLTILAGEARGEGAQRVLIRPRQAALGEVAGDLRERWVVKALPAHVVVAQQHAEPLVDAHEVAPRRFRQRTPSLERRGVPALE